MLRILLLLALLATNTHADTTPTSRAAIDCGELKTIYVISHGWHTGIALHAADLNRRLPPLRNRFAEHRFYEIGWGDADFYQAADITTALVLRALFASRGTVMHVVAFDTEPGARFARSHVLALQIAVQDYEHMLDYISTSFTRDANGAISALRAGLYGDSEFYQATGKFSALHTCNTWAADALRHAGLDIGATVTAGGVMNGVASLAGKACDASRVENRP